MAYRLQFISYIWIDLKTKLTTILFFAIIFLSLLFFSACQKQVPCAGQTGQTYNYYVSADNKSKIPYTGTDTLVYISNVGDTAILYGQGKQTSMAVFSGTKDPDPDCAGIVSYWNFDHITITFTGANPELNKLFYILNYPYFISNPYYPPTPETSGDNLGIEISSSLSSFISWPTLAVYANDSTRYTDTVTINGSLYKGVDLCDSSKVLYNYHYGILRFIDANKRIWTKIM